MSETRKVTIETIAKPSKAAPMPSASGQPVAGVSKSTAGLLDKMAQSAPKPAAETKPSSAAKGDWMVQLMSSPNQKAVASAWNNMAKKHSVLSGLNHEIETADLGAKGTYYRLLAGGFADRSDADKICNTIKKQGGSCIVKKK